MSKMRIVPESNYTSLFTDDFTTIRWRTNPNLPIAKLKYPELVDISLGTLCDGRCPYCYVSATPRGTLYDNVVEKTFRYFGTMAASNRPYQVAIGGGGEPTLHPDFVEILIAFNVLNIVSNYTTHGQNLSSEILDASERLCGGVAVTAHTHLPWQKGVGQLLERKIRTNIHIIVGPPGSAERALSIRQQYPEVEFVVLLPYQAVGFAKQVDLYFDECAQLLVHDGFAIGALFQEHIESNQMTWEKYGLSVYDHELFSGYLPLDDQMIMRKSSYNVEIR